MLVCLTVPEQREVVRRGRRRRVQRGAVAQRRHHLQARAERRPRLRRVAPALLQQLVPAHQGMNLTPHSTLMRQKLLTLGEPLLE